MEVRIWNSLLNRLNKQRYPLFKVESRDLDILCRFICSWMVKTTLWSEILLFSHTVEWGESNRSFMNTLFTVINETFKLHFYMAFKVSFPYEFITTLVAVLKNTFMLCCYMLFNISFWYYFITTLVTVINNTFMLHFYRVFKVSFPLGFITTLVADIKNTLMVLLHVA